MSIVLMVIFVQLIFAAVVFFILKKLLDRELLGAALEKFESCESSPAIKEITVYSASRISDESRGRFESIRQRKFSGANLNFMENAGLKGGLVISMENVLLDFSLYSRLHNFWLNGPGH
jgi:F0F1-type ATP synthase delta subunit